MTNQEPVSPAKAKYLKRMARQTKDNNEQSARRRNTKERAALAQSDQAKRNQVIADRGPWRPSYTEAEVKRMESRAAFRMNALAKK